MKPRKNGAGTAFRGSQVRVLLVGMLRVVASRMVAPLQLRALVRELADDEVLWRELAPPPLEVHGKATTPATSAVMTAPIAEHGAPFDGPTNGIVGAVAELAEGDQP